MLSEVPMRSLLKFIVVLAVAGVFIALLFRPKDEGGGYDPYFATLNGMLKAGHAAGPVAIVDLDRVDANLAAIQKHLGPARRYRIVEKSLPSLELIKYVVAKSGAHRIMAFHEPYLALLYRELPADTDFLLGKPMPIDAARAFYAGVPTAARAGAAARVQWLVDTTARLEEYRALAAELGVPLRVNLEIDVGLHRGGAKTIGELDALFTVIAAHAKELQFSGLMGYDGHIPHVPGFFGPREGAMRAEARRVAARYQAFVDYGKQHHPNWFGPGVTLNGAGSRTYELYSADDPLNDLSMGSAVVKPAHFSDFSLADHAPALFIATPILKRLEGFEVPFLDAVAGLAVHYNPNWQRTFYVYGGAWSPEILAPTGIAENPLSTPSPNANLLPNQYMLNGSRAVQAGVGDFVFYRPGEGDAIFQFERILVVRGGKVVDTWRPLPSRL
jgi:D-serine deaminase-like pyridoxal phosphate-dependent protein